jgi:hypothetical protein
MSRLNDTRLYVVTATDSGGERLLRASNKSRAVRLAATARVATTEDLERLFAAGVKPEGGPSDRRPSRARR